jgi:hypothetical protein
MTTFLCLSHRHGLLPIANILQKEGHIVEHIPWRSQYGRAWEGSIETTPKEFNRRTKEEFAPLIEKAQAGELIVLSDTPKWDPIFGTSQRYYGTSTPTLQRWVLRLGLWIDHEGWWSPHFLVIDPGAFTGAQGLPIDGALTLIHQQPDPNLFEQVRERLPKHGLAQVHVEITPEGLIPKAVESGWHPLHWHAFLAAMGDQALGPVLEGKGSPILSKRHAVAVPVTVPPWPNGGGKSVEQPIAPMPSEDLNRIFWHDIRVENNKLLVAGLDGFVGVAAGVGESFLVAQRQALRVAHGIQMGARQFRTDAGVLVPTIMASLEEAGLLR